MCVLVPQSLNGFLVMGCFRETPLKLGVFKSATGRFRAGASIEGRVVKLGTFDTEDEAHAAYKVAKEAEAYRWYERLKAGEFIVDPRVIERMRTWKLEPG